MRKLALAVALAAGLSIVVYASEVGVLDFSFVAPSVPSTSDAPNQVGLIVYDTTNKVFWGRSTNTTPNEWTQLSLSAGNQVPSGTILPFGGTTAPTGYLLADGSAVSRVTYAALFSAIGTAFGSGDGSTTFNLPDLRGRFLRGVDGGTTRDPDAASRTAMNTGGNTGNNVGSVQSHAFQTHTHSIQGYNATSNNNMAAGATSLQGTYSTGAPNSGSTSSETRPLNAYVTYIVKY